MSDHSRRVRDRISHACAAAFLLVALAHGLALTRGKAWPDGPDTFRDIGAAQTIRETLRSSLRSRTPLPDLYYKNEVFWYSPLMPAALAASAAIAHVPIHVAAVRFPVFWNLAGPIAFYVMAAVFFDPLIALVALACFLFVEPFPAREAGTYAPALIASSFAQAFLYLGLLAWWWFRRSAAAVRAVLAGAVLGASFLAHTAVTAILAAVFVFETLGWLVAVRDSAERVRVALLCALAAGVGVLAASPALIPLAHYHMRIRELEPFVYLDPAMGPSHIGDVLRVNFNADRLFMLLACAGVVAVLLQPKSASRRLVLAWTAIAVAMFVWAAWFVRLNEQFASMAIAPAHHFLIYTRAAESLLAGVAVVTLVRLVSSRTSPSLDLPVAAAAALVLVAVNWPRYLERDTRMGQPEFSPSQQAAVEWIINRSAPSSVFLAPQNTGVSMIGIVRRKTVLVEPVFSNPYVAWQPRFDAWNAMWDALERGDCAAFATQAAPYDVTHVLLVDGMTPPVAAGECGLRKVFEAPPFAILSRVVDAPQPPSPSFF